MPIVPEAILFLSPEGCNPYAPGGACYLASLPSSEGGCACSHRAYPRTFHAVDRRLASTRLEIETAIAVLGGMILLVVDAWGLSLIPLVGNLEKTYSLSPSQASWTLSVAGLVAAGCVPTVARLGDRLGMRRLVLASMTLGVVANVICAVAPGFGLLLFGRAILGVSAAIPLVYAILRARGTSQARVTRGVGILSAAAGLGVAVSYLLSGLTIQANGSVRTVFWVIAALAAVSLLLAWFYLPDSHIRSSRADRLGRRRRRVHRPGGRCSRDHRRQHLGLDNARQHPRLAHRGHRGPRTVGVLRDQEVLAADQHPADHQPDRGALLPRDRAAGHPGDLRKPRAGHLHGAADYYRLWAGPDGPAVRACTLHDLASRS